MPDHSSALIGEPARLFIREHLGPSARLKEIAGDASTRRFYRVTSGRRAAVLIVHPEPLPPDAPLFSNHRVMEGIGAPVPRILAADPRDGLVLTEDLGDTTLQKHLLRGRPPGPKSDAGRRRLYRQACDLIALLQKKGSKALAPGDFASRNALDRERFLFELDHFHRHFIRGIAKRTPVTAEEELLRAFYADLAQDCDLMPRAYCHRDFQSRNLMLQRGRLRLIDFQDARMGPYVYDAASLLRDSSLDLDETLVEEMTGYLARRLDEGPEEFRVDFDRMALQRNIKDLGTFAYLVTVRGLRSYQEYIPRTLRSVRRALLRDRRYHRVYPVLERLALSYPEAA